MPIRPLLRRCAPPLVVAFAIAACCCGETTGPDSGPLSAGQYRGTITGMVNATASGTAVTIGDVPVGAAGYAFWIELRDERNAAHSTLVRIGAANAPTLVAGQTYGVTASDVGDPFHAEFYEYEASTYTAHVTVPRLTGTITVDSVSATHVQGRFSLQRTGTDAATGQTYDLRVAGRFHTQPAPHPPGS